jgi:hypothetical protein
MLNLDESSIESLRKLPESGMGFQLVDIAVWGNKKPFLVFNSKRAIDLSQISLESGDDPAVILRNGMKIVDLLRDDTVETMFMAPQPTSFVLLNARIPVAQALRAVMASAAVKVALPSSLVKHVSLSADRVFHRFSAFSPDLRVDPVTGNFLPGTYACPESELPFVPTGFAAVGRFALPNNLPASYHYEITAPKGTAVDFGTVAPAFGQAGGGVEAYFASGAVNAKSPPTAHPSLPDE